MRKIKYFYNEECSPCVLMCQGFIPTRILLDSHNIKYEIEKVIVDEDKAPQVEFYNDDIKTGTLQGLPFVENQKLQTLVIQRFILHGLLDAEFDDKLVSLINSIDKLYKELGGK